MAARLPHYRVQLHPPLHQLSVELTVCSQEPRALGFFVPTWVPGAYAFMKYGRNLFEVTAADEAGQPLAIEREGWTGFRLGRPVRQATIRYRVLLADAAWGELCGLIEADRAVLLGTSYLMVEGEGGPCRVTYQAPSGWPIHHPAGARPVDPETWEYPSYRVLFDTPVVLGKFERITRPVRGTPFHFVFLDRALGWESELEGLLSGLVRIAEECHRLFGSFPFEDYTFVFSFNPQAKWGLEHSTSTMIGLTDSALIDPDQRARCLRVSAHELFHAWNVHRLRPAALASLDLRGGSFPDGLWVSEGFTRYYEFLLGVRTGAMSPEAFFSNVVNYYRQLSALPAYRRASGRDSSLATFLNHNRYPGSVNNTIDYYDQGMLVAFDLDVALRAKGRTLDQAFVDLYRSFESEGKGFGLSDALEHLSCGIRTIRQALEAEVTRPGALSTVERLEGLGFQVQAEAVPYLGLVLQENLGPLIENILDDGPSAMADLCPGDEIVRVDGYPFSLKGLKWLIAHREDFSIDVRRGHRFIASRLTVGRRQDVRSLVWRGTPEQGKAIASWLSQPWTPSAGLSIPLTSYENFHGIQTVI